MKKVKSIIFALVLMLSMTLFVAGCGKTTTKATSKIKVKSIEQAESASLSVSPIRMAKLNAPVKYDADDNTKDPGFNYFVIFKNKNEISITVTVDNPQAVQIDMIKISSDEDTAKIKTYTNQEATWQVIKDQPVVGWNGSNVYKSTWDLYTTGTADEVNFTITDFKVNGKWQNSTDLGKNLLKVYKIDSNLLSLEVFSNDFINNDVNKSEEKFRIKFNTTNIIVKDVLVGATKVDKISEDVYHLVNEDASKYENVNKNVKILFTIKLTDTIESEVLETELYPLHLLTIKGKYVFDLASDNTHVDLYTDVKLSGDLIANETYEFYYEGTKIIPETSTLDGYTYKFNGTSAGWTTDDAIKADMLKITIKVKNYTFKIVNASDRNITFALVTE